MALCDPVVDALRVEHVAAWLQHPHLVVFGKGTQTNTASVRRNSRPFTAKKQGGISFELRRFNCGHDFSKSSCACHRLGKLSRTGRGQGLRSHAPIANQRDQQEPRNCQAPHRRVMPCEAMTLILARRSERGAPHEFQSVCCTRPRHLLLKLTAKKLGPTSTYGPLGSLPWPMRTA